MKVSDFQFELPSTLIADAPAATRSASRLLHLDAASGEINHYRFSDVPRLLASQDLLVFNNTRVIPARLFGRKESGGKVEVLLERITGEFTAIAQLRASKSPPPGTRLVLEDDQSTVTVIEREGSFFVLEFAEPVAAVTASIGHMPLPPYIERADQPVDRERYQTVYASRDGAVAAPTAGLHFDDDVLAAIDNKGIAKTEVTLHVGAGTFQPVRVDEVEDHKMHAEWLEVGRETCDAVEGCRARSGRVVAVGTTSVRSLESASADGRLMPFVGDTEIFIYPGYEFRSVEAMITNFHLPGSTLLMLVSAFAGIENIQRAYKVAVEDEYRFFSYGDAMLITR